PQGGGAKDGRADAQAAGGLAAELARYDLATLKDHAPGRPMANPHVVTVEFGDRKASLTLAPGAPLPRPDPKKPLSSVPGRYAGIRAAVSEALGLTARKPGGK